MVDQIALILLLLICLAVAAPDKDLVTSLPGFDHMSWPFRVYSGFLDVPGPINGYDSVKIHYQFHTSQRDPSNDPVVTWHQGGPGGSSILIGLYGEMGVFRIGENGNYLNPWAWNKVANMLYLESPAGSGMIFPPGPHQGGFSLCIKGGVAVQCRWNDVTQAEAYAHTLQAFFRAFPEFAQNELYLSGESYFGQYGPNIAHFITSTDPFRGQLNLRGIMLGNACWGGNETCVTCNGPSGDRIIMEFLFKKGLFAPKLYKQIRAACAFPDTTVECLPRTNISLLIHTFEPGHQVGSSVLSAACKGLLHEMKRQSGPYDLYNVYNNCPGKQQLLDDTAPLSGVHDPVMSGGYSWDCLSSSTDWITRPDVRKALHLDKIEPGASSFDYTISGPASITIYPILVKKLRVLIYNGDADACVPYIGNEEWIYDLEGRGILEESSPWTPWYTSNHSGGPPAGYITRYAVPGSEQDFSFATVRLAGHMVPQFQPEAAFALLSRFLAGSKGNAVDSSSQEDFVV